MDLGAFISKTPIEKGWSPDRKYRVEDERGNAFLLRVSPAGRLAQAQRMHSLMQQCETLGVPMCRAVACGLCGQQVYALHSWIDGEDVQDVLPRLSPGEAYGYGLEAGRILRLIHSLPAPEELEPWEVRFARKMDRKLAQYRACPIPYEGGEAFADYIAQNRCLIKGRPQCRQHGDYHTGNMMIDRSGKLCIIDFDREDCGDPWEEFNRIVWCAQLSPAFASGMVDGYFDGSVPPEFWPLLALYIASNTLGSVCWALQVDPAQVDVMLHQAQDVLDWYDDMRRVIPSWYENRASSIP